MGIPEPQTTDDNESFLDELPPGTELLQGQYKINEFLNSGGFGITYLASDSLDRKVVIKECFPSSFCNRSRTIVQARSRAHTKELRSVVQLFVQEARSLAKLNHPNIVGVHQVFEDNDTAYMVLDFVEGRDLLDTLEDANHGLTPAQIKGILKDVLSAVGFIHSQDILHRDISPDNILLDADMRPVLIDFGAAREEATKKSRVLSALRVVKDGYSPQEFYVQGSEQTPSSDLYALGATFYHLIAGEIPPNSQARLAAIASGEEDPYQPLVGRIKGYDSKFLGAIDRALGILPKDRMQSADEWLTMMEGRRKSRVVTQPAPVSSAAAASQPQRKSALVPLLGSAAVIAILAVGGLAFSGKLSSFEEEAPVAETAGAAAPVVAETVTEDTTETAQAVPAEVVDTPATDETETATVAPDDVVEAAPTETAGVAPVKTPAPAETDSAPAEVAEAPAEVTDEPVVTPDATDGDAVAEVEAPVVIELAPAEVAEAPEAPAEPVVPDAPQPEVWDTPDALTVAETDTATPSIPAETGSSLRPQSRPEVAAPTAPAQDSIETVAQAADDIPAPAPVVEEPTVVAASLSVGLPFEGEPGSNVISKSADVAPIWVRPGTRVEAINGILIDDIADIDRVVQALSGPADVEFKELVFTVRGADETSSSDHRWVVPIKHVTALPNGASFETFRVNDTWRTVVTAVPEDAGEMLVGDIVVAYVETSETLTGHDTLRDILARELAEGKTQFNFAVSREGSMWVVPMTYAEGA